MLSKCNVITRRLNSSGKRFCGFFLKTLITPKGSRGVEGLLSAILLHVFKFLRVGQHPLDLQSFGQKSMKFKTNKYLLLQYDMKERFSLCCVFF